MTADKDLSTKEREIWGRLCQLTAADGKTRASARQHDIVTTLTRINSNLAIRVKQFPAAGGPFTSPLS